MLRLSKNERGITLIALVITIIVLLILAGISISMLSGDNSILGKGTEAKNQTNENSLKEKVQIAVMGAITDGAGQLKDTTLRNELKNSIHEVTDNDITGNEKYGWQIKIDTKAFAISKNGEVNEAFWEEIRDENGYITEIRRVDGTVTGLNLGDKIGYSAIDGVNSENRTIISYGAVTGLGENNDQTIQIEAGTWKLLGVENGKLKIISDIVGRIPESGETNLDASKILKLSGRTGYNNAEDELNRVCSLYGKGKYADSARSINVDDINRITGYDPNAIGIKNPTPEQIASGTKYGQGDNNPFQYGRKVTYLWSGNSDKKPQYTYTGRETPGTLAYTHEQFTWFDGKIWNRSYYEEGKIGEICKITTNCYSYNPITLTTSDSGNVVGISTNSNEYILLFDKNNFGNGDKECYWLASKCILAAPDLLWYNIFRVVRRSCGKCSFDCFDTAKELLVMVYDL